MESPGIAGEAQRPSHEGMGGASGRIAGKNWEALNIVAEVESLGESDTMVLMNDHRQLQDGEAAASGGAPVGDGESRPEGLAGALQAIKTLANGLETKDAAKALADGRRKEMTDLLLLVDGLRRVVDSAESRAQSSGFAASSRSSESNSLAMAREVVQNAMPSTGAPGPASRSLTQFFRTQDELVKWGQVGTSKEYRHFVPLIVVSRVVAWIEDGPAKNGSAFAFEDVRDQLAGDGLKGYQMRIAIAWLRESKLIRMPARGRYFASPGIKGDAEDALANLRPESERKSPPKKRTRKKAKTANKPKAGGRSRKRGV